MISSSVHITIDNLYQKQTFSLYAMRELKLKIFNQFRKSCQPIFFLFEEPIWFYWNFISNQPCEITLGCIVINPKSWKKMKETNGTLHDQNHYWRIIFSSIVLLQSVNSTKKNLLPVSNLIPYYQNRDNFI